MALLLFICWCILESKIIPPGFLKLFYLSFYIHPLFLFFFQIFLWLNQLWTCLLRLICSLLRLTSIFLSFFAFYTSTKLPNTTTTTSTTSAHATAAQTVKRPDINVVKQTLISQHKSYVLNNHHRYLLTETSSEIQMSTVLESNHLLEENRHHVHEALANQEEDLIDEATSIISQHDHLSSSFSYCTTPLTISSSSLQVMSFIAAENLEDDMEVLDMEEEESDPFYQKYSDRMRWFDKLNQDKAFAIGEILERELDIPQNSNTSSSSSSSSWVKKIAAMLRSLESDLELVYVAHSCLSWDTLYHQYKKVEDVHDQNMNMNLNYNYNYSTIVADRFQKFQILLERFTEENDRKKKMRHFIYVHSRLISFNTLLQVPPLSDQEVMVIGSMSEASSAIEVVKGIEKCVEAFWQFIRTANNNKKKGRFPWIGSPPPVEDPRDIKLFLQLTKTLKKEMWMKKLQGKRRCCVRKLAVRLAASAMEEESEKKVMMFTMIEIKLVAMVLNMSIVSSSHLKWCQHKLNSIHFTHEGRIITTKPSSSFTSPSSCLFPIS